MPSARPYHSRIQFVGDRGTAFLALGIVLSLTFVGHFLFVAAAFCFLLCAALWYVLPLARRSVEHGRHPEAKRPADRVR